MARAKQPSKQAVARALGTRRLGLHWGAEGFVPGALGRILLAVVHLLLERLRFFLVAERQPRQTFLELKGVEEDAVLVVREGVVDLLVPYHTAAGRLKYQQCSSTKSAHTPKCRRA